MNIYIDYAESNQLQKINRLKVWYYTSFNGNTVVQIDNKDTC